MSDDGASIAIAEQHGVVVLVILVYFLGGFKVELPWLNFVKRNFCNCGLSSAINSVESVGNYCEEKWWFWFGGG